MVDEIGNCCCDTSCSRAAGEPHDRRRTETELVIELARFEIRIERLGRQCRRHLALNDVDLFFRKFRQSFGRQAKVLCEHFERRARHPVGDAERAELGEPAVVEDEQKVTLLRSEPLNRVTVSLGEIPHVTRTEIRDLRVARRCDHRYAAPPTHDVGPLRRDRVPMQLAQRAGFQPHRNRRETRRDRKLVDRMLSRRAGGAAPSARFFELEFKVRQIGHY